MQKQKKLKGGETPEQKDMAANAEAADKAAAARDFLAKLDGQIEKADQIKAQETERRQERPRRGGCACNW